MQPLGTKKNHATSRERKKITQRLGTKKITPPLGTKKIKQPLGTKKITQPLRTKKITLSIGPNAFKLVRKAPFCSKWQ